MEYDYLVIGSGAAGSVVAARLAEGLPDGETVCVVEAGGSDRHPFVSIPAGFVKNLNKASMMWQFESKSGPNTADRSVYLPQGKILGGSTSINGLIYNRGWSGDFDAWAAAGNPGWSYQDVLPFFRKAESRHTESEPESQYRGALGPIRVSDPQQTNPVCDAFIDAVGTTGVPVGNDYNGESQRGTGYYQRFVHRGKRETVARRYLSPARTRKNLEVKLNTTVTGIFIESGKATGVEISRGGKVGTLRCRKELLICSGTVNTVRLLELSGIGNGELLRDLGIPVVHHLPGVGENFQDHYFVRLAARLKPESQSLNTQAKGLSLAREICRWVAGRPSILSYSPSIAYAFLNSEHLEAQPATALPDLQFVFSHGSYKPGKVYELDDFPAATCGFTQQRPESRGHVHLVSPDPRVSPEIQPNYLMETLDQITTIRGIRMARSFLCSEAMRQWFQEEVSPGKDFGTDEQLLDYARRTGNTGYHLVGTCKMGPASDPLAVVDSELKVHGLQGLRVIDASVMPSVTSSNTCAATIMIGEKAADAILRGRAR